MSNKTEIEIIDKAIKELVYDKVAIRKAYQYYHCRRDDEQFKNLEENYGIGSPTSVEFTPLIKKHIDVLVGQYLGLEQDLKITCKDSDTVSNIVREKQLKIQKAIHDYLHKYLVNNIIAAIVDNKEITNDPYIEKELQKVKDDIESNFVSDYEIAGQNILQYIKQSRNIDLKNKLRLIFVDLLVAGVAYYRTKVTESKTNINFERLNPLDTFIDRNPDSTYLNDSRRVVVRKYMTRENILYEYGDELTSEAIDELNELVDKGTSSDTYYIQVGARESVQRSGGAKHGILGGLEVIPSNTSSSYGTNYNDNIIAVYEVEWLQYDRENKKLDRYEGVRIGETIYITRGKSEFVSRSIDTPGKCGLSVNGIFFLDTNGEPFSLIVNTMSLQDKYDLLIYYRDNLIANSGTVGDWLDLASLPAVLGEETPERIQQWLAYKKNGVGLIDTSQEGQPMNTIFNGFDDTVKAQSIQAIQIAIQSIEQQASSITGVLPEMLAQYEQRDAVSNVKLGVTTSGLLTKQYFNAMDSLYKEVNYDLLNLAKLVYKDGIQGTLILGDHQSKIFSALPEYYTITDFDIHIEDSTQSFQNMQEMKMLNIEMIKAGMSDPLLALDIATAKNLSSLKKQIGHAMKIKKSENDMIEQMQQQLQQAGEQVSTLTKQNQELQQQLQKAQKQTNEFEQARLQLDQQRLELDKEKAKNDKEYNDKMIETKNKQVEAQVAQIFDANPYNNKIQKVI